MNIAASLRAAPIDVQLGEWVYTIPALPAADWLEAVLKGWGGVVPGMFAGNDEVAVLADHLTGRVTGEEIEAAARGAAEEASGWRWWAIERLTAAVTQPDQWPSLHGGLLLRGVDPAAVPFGALLNALYALLTEHMKPEKRESFDFQLNAPPPKAVVEAWDDQAAADDFMMALGEQASLHRRG